MRMCTLVAKAKESRTHTVGKREMYKEERDVFKVRKIDECDMRILVHYQQMVARKRSLS